MALRAGARVANLDMPYLHAGPRFFSRSGKATWIGVYTDFYGKTVGPFVTAPTRELLPAVAPAANKPYTLVIAV